MSLSHTEPPQKTGALMDMPSSGATPPTSGKLSRVSEEESPRTDTTISAPASPGHTSLGVMHSIEKPRTATTTAPGNGFFNESLKQYGPSDTLGSSLGLPSELLGSLSGSSSHFASDTDGDTIRSALASALGLHAHSAGDSGMLLSAEGSLDGVPSLSLSQSLRSLPRDLLEVMPLSPSPTPSPTPRGQVQLSSTSGSVEVCTRFWLGLGLVDMPRANIVLLLQWNVDTLKSGHLIYTGHFAWS